MNARERQLQQRQDNRQRILDAAREMFGAEGYEAVTMRRIGERVGQSATALYFHFQDKEALVRELCTQDFAALAQRFVRITEIPDPVEQLRAIGRGYIDFAIDHPNHYRFMFLTRFPVLPLDARQERMRGNPTEDAYALLKAIVGACIAAGRFRPEFHDAEAVTQLCWGAANGLVSLHAIREMDPWIQWRRPRENAYLLLDALLRGLEK